MNSNRSQKCFLCPERRSIPLCGGRRDGVGAFFFFLGFLHFPPAMILRYFSALWAALALAASMLGAKPWHTVIGCVDSSTRHWHRPLRLRSSAAEEGRQGQEKVKRTRRRPTFLRRLTQVQVADVEALLQGQVAEQGAEVGVGGHFQRVAAQLEDLLAGRVAQGVPRAAEAFVFARLGPAPHVLCVRSKVQVQ